MNTLSDDVGQYWRPFFRLDIEWDNKERDDMQNSVNFAFQIISPYFEQKFYHESKDLKCKCRYFPKIPPILPAHSFLEVCYALFQRTPGQQ